MKIYATIDPAMIARSSLNSILQLGDRKLMVSQSNRCYWLKIGSILSISGLVSGSICGIPIAERSGAVPRSIAILSQTLLRLTEFAQASTQSLSKSLRFDRHPQITTFFHHSTGCSHSHAFTFGILFAGKFEIDRGRTDAEVFERKLPNARR